MNIGELFVNLGVKGSDKSIGAVTGIQSGMKKTASMSLEAKAAIVGVIYAFERMMSASGQRGTDLSNFNAQLGISAKTLQQYQYAAQQVGVSNQEVEGTFKNLQGAMAKTLMGEGAPKGMARLAQVTGQITAETVKQWAQAPDLLFQRLQTYAQKENNPWLKNEVLKSFGVGDGMNAAFSRNAFRPEVMKKAPTYSDGEIKSLDKANAAWSNLGTKIEMAMGHFNAKHGGQLVGDISKVTDKVIKLVEAFMKFSEVFHLFEKIGKIFEGWEHIFAGLTWAVETLTGLSSDDPKKNGKAQKSVDGALGEAKSIGSHLLNKFMDSVLGDDVSGKAIDADARSEYAAMRKRLDAKQVAAPTMPAEAGSASSPTSNTVTLHQHFNHDGKDPKKVGDASVKGIQSAYRQIPQGGQ